MNRSPFIGLWAAAALAAASPAGAAAPPPTLTAGAAAPPAAALQPAALPPATPPLPADSPSSQEEVWLVTISGGVSLGAYEAGVLYMTNEIFKRAEPRRRIVLTTGASAGGVNALTTALTSCEPPQADPTLDLGWRAWMDLGFEQLFVPEDVGSTHIFSGAALARTANILRERWEGGLPDGCDVVVGATVTRLSPLPLLGSERFGLDRETERFVFRVRGQGRGQAPAVANHVDPRSPIPPPRLPFVRGEGDRNFGYLRGVFLASAAFPAAFPPQVVPHCLTAPPGGVGCAPEDVRRDLFIDGGVFDNDPLRLAFTTAADSLTPGPDGRLGWRDPARATSRVRTIPPSVELLYVNPNRTLYPPVATRGDQADAPELLGLLGKKVADFIHTARSRELLALVEEYPQAGARVHATARRYPTASGHISAFLGFFERDLRAFDFYLGMYDAYHDLGGADVRQAYLPKARGARGLPEAWRPFACLLSAFDGEEVLEPACEGSELDNFRILTQVAVDRVYDHCRALDAHARPTRAQHPHCARAADGEPAPRLFEQLPGAPTRRGEGEGDFGYTMRLLTEYGFEWRDLGLTPKQAEYGKVKVRRKLLAALELLAERQQELLAQQLVLTGGRLGVNTITYEPPRGWVYAVAGSNIEIGASLLPFDWNESWLRLSVAASVDNLLSRLTGGAGSPLLFDLSAGPELQLLFITTPLFQPMLGLRAGYRLSTADSLGADACTSEAAAGDGRQCSQALLQVYAAVALIERFRFQLTFGVTPFGPDFDDAALGLRVGFGLHFF